MRNRWLGALTLGALVLALSTGARAQGAPEIGVTGGAAYTGIGTGDLGEGTELSHSAGWTAGVFARFPLTDALSLGPELLYARKGASESIRLDAVGRTLHRSYTLDYLEAPLLARLEIAESAPVTPFVVAGAAPAVALRARSRVDDTIEELGDRVRRFDVGVAAGLGAELDTRWGTGELHARYTAGLLDIDRSGLPGSNRNRSLAILAAFAVGNPF